MVYKISTLLRRFLGGYKQKQKLIVFVFGIFLNAKRQSEKNIKDAIARGRGGGC